MKHCYIILTVLTFPNQAMYFFSVIKQLIKFFEINIYLQKRKESVCYDLLIKKAFLLAAGKK